MAAVCGRQSIAPQSAHGGLGTGGGAGGGVAAEDDDDAWAVMRGRCYNRSTMPGEQREPQQLQELIEQARQLVAADRLAEAEAACQAVLAESPEQADVLNLLGVIALKTGRLTEAEAAFRRAIAVNPASPEAHNNLGETLRRVGRGEEAVDVLLRALVLRPNYPQAARNLERVYATLDHAALVRIGEAL